jgi:hypothetical protein
MGSPMRRIEPAYPDLIPVSHVVRPGYLPGQTVELDPIRMTVVWKDAPRRILPAERSVPRHPVRAIVFARVGIRRPEVIETLLERGSAVLLVLDEADIGPRDLGLDDTPGDTRITPVLPVLPSPVGIETRPVERWNGYRWGAVLGLFPFPGAEEDLEARVTRLKESGATFAVAAPLLLTPKDRHRILDDCDGNGNEDELENALFHADVARGLHALERQAGINFDAMGIEPVIGGMVPEGFNHVSVRTASLLRLWARRLDQSREESSWGWRLRRAATALDRLPKNPQELDCENNLRVIPGFDPWVLRFTRAIWNGGDPVRSSWRRWSGKR